MISDRKIEEALRYLGAREDERLSPHLVSFLESAERRMADQEPRLPFDFTLTPQRRIAFLIESWLAANAVLGQQPLWPKDYDPNDRPLRVEGARPLPIVPRDDRPDWMKRRWI